VLVYGLYVNGVDMVLDVLLFSKVFVDFGYDCGLVGKFYFGVC